MDTVTETSAQTAPSTPSPEAKRRIWHYVPFARQRTEDAIKHGPALAAALQPWIDAAQAGLKRDTIKATHRYAIDMAGREKTTRVELQSPTEIRDGIVTVLAKVEEWDGYLVARELSYYGFPSDAELVQAIHRWSCKLKSDSIAEWKARKAAKGGRAA